MSKMRAKHRRVVCCPECEFEEIRDTRDWMRAAMPRCSRCGAGIPKGLHLSSSGLPLPKRFQKKRRFLYGVEKKIRRVVRCVCLECKLSELVSHKGPMSEFNVRCSCGGEYQIKDVTEVEREHAVETGN